MLWGVLSQDETSLRGLNRDGGGSLVDGHYTAIHEGLRGEAKAKGGLAAQFHTDLTQSRCVQVNVVKRLLEGVSVAVIIIRWYLCQVQVEGRFRALCGSGGSCNIL